MFPPAPLGSRMARRHMAWAALFLGAFLFYAWRAYTLPWSVWDEDFYLELLRHQSQGSWFVPDSDPWHLRNREHPPLAKLLGVWAIRSTPAPVYTMRWLAALAAASGLVGVSMLARRFFGTTAAALAPALLLVDPLWDVLARIYTFDIFATVGMVWAFVFAFRDGRASPWAAGAAAGFAVACKFAAFMLFPALLVVLGWRFGRHTPRLPGPGPLVSRVWVRARTAIGAAVVLPGAILFSSYYPAWAAVRTQEGTVAATGQTVSFILDGLELGSTALIWHPLESPPSSWLFLKKPMLVHAEPGVVGDGVMHLVYFVGSPVVWWGALLGAILVLLPPLVGLAHRAVGDQRIPRVRHTPSPEVRDVRTRGPSMGLATAIMVAGLSPFFLLDRATFLYYMALVTPYFAVMLAGALGGLLHGTWGSCGSRMRRIVVISVLAAAVGLYLYWWPLFNATPIDLERVETLQGLLPWADWDIPADVPDATEPFMGR